MRFLIAHGLRYKNFLLEFLKQKKEVSTDDNIRKNIYNLCYSEKSKLHLLRKGTKSQNISIEIT